MTPSEITALRRNLFQNLARGNLGEARGAYERLREIDPLAVETRGGELELLVAEERLDEAEAVAEVVLREFPGSARVHLAAGRLSYRRKRYSAAVESFQESLRLFDSWRTRWWLGRSLTQAGNFDDAARQLESLVVDHPVVLRDLAWLQERIGDTERAIEALESYLSRYSDDRLASRQLVRLKAAQLEPDSLIEQVDNLRELGEAIPDAVLPRWIEAMLGGGHGQVLRRELMPLIATLESKTASQAAWVCYRSQAHDVALELFVRAFTGGERGHTNLSAMESAARKSGRLELLEELYSSATDQDPRFWGRLRRIAKWQEKD